MHLSMAELLRVRDNRLTGLAEDRSRSLRVLRGHIAGCPACADALADVCAAAPVTRAADAADDQSSNTEAVREARATEAATLAELLRKRSLRPALPTSAQSDPRPLPVRRLVLVCVLLVVAAVVGNYYRN